MKWTPGKWLIQAWSTAVFGFGTHNIPFNAGNVGGTPIEYDDEPLIGFRTWFPVHTHSGIALKSMHQSHIWQPGKNTAACHPFGAWNDRSQHRAPDLDCACGFYAQLPDHPFTEWQHFTRSRVAASGQIRMWGRVIECDRGWKAEHVELDPDAPVILETSCKHDCPNEPSRIELAVPQSQLWCWCDEHGPPKNRGEDMPSVDAAVFLPELARQLSAKYDREFLYWSML